VTYDKKTPEASDDRTLLHTGICPDCAAPKWCDEPICAACRGEPVEPPGWLGWFMLAMIVILLGATALVINAQIVQARSAQTEQGK